MPTSPSRPRNAARSPQVDVITKLEQDRNSKVIVYITGDRIVKSGNNIFPGLSTQVAPEILPIFDEILRQDSSTPKVTLVIYTNGGLIETPWPLVSLIREKCVEFEVIVLKKALSAGTLIALGSDRIIIPRASFLSPVDPARQLGANKKLEIEDIIGFIDFAKDKVGINDQATLGEVLKELSKEIEPSIIGSINRTHSLVRSLAKKLLDLHTIKIPEHQSKALIENLTEKLFSHTHLISSREAKEIGFGDLIESPSLNTQKIVDELYDEYSQLMKLNDPLVIDKLISTIPDLQQGRPYTEKCLTAIVHSRTVKYKFEPTLTVSTNNQPGAQQQVNIHVSNLEWEKE